MSLTSEDLQSIKALIEGITSHQIEKLAVMINNSFQKVEKRFESIAQHLQSVDKRLDEQTQQVTQTNLTLTDHGLLLHRIDGRTHDQQQRLDHHEMRVRRMEKHQGLRPLPLSGKVDV